MRPNGPSMRPIPEHVVWAMRGPFVERPWPAWSVSQAAARVGGLGFSGGWYAPEPNLPVHSMMTHPEYWSNQLEPGQPRARYSRCDVEQGIVEVALASGRFFESTYDPPLVRSDAPLQTGEWEWVASHFVQMDVAFYDLPGYPVPSLATADVEISIPEPRVALDRPSGVGALSVATEIDVVVAGACPIGPVASLPFGWRSGQGFHPPRVFRSVNVLSPKPAALIVSVRVKVFTSRLAGPEYPYCSMVGNEPPPCGLASIDFLDSNVVGLWYGDTRGAIRVDRVSAFLNPIY